MFGQTKMSHENRERESQRVNEQLTAFKKPCSRE